MSEENKTQKTAAELAMLFGVNRSTVSRHINNGNIIKVSETKTEKPLYDPEQAGPFLHNSVLNNRKINSQKIPVTSPIDTCNVKTPARRTDFYEWIIDLFGEDFAELDDHGKIVRARALRESRMAFQADMDARKSNGSLLEKGILGPQIKMISAAWCATAYFPVTLVI